MNAYEFIIKMKNYASSELRKVAQELGIADKKSKEFTNDLKKNESAAKSLGSALGGLKGKLVGLFAGISMMAFVDQVITARAEYEKFDAVLTNTFQSKDVGQGALAMLTDFAAKTPYQLNELTGGFIKLVNRGILPTKDEMTKMGDLASSQGKSFDQLVEGILDAQSGEFTRLKEFGMQASKSGDKVKLTFMGVTKEVDNNEKAIKDAIISYGGMKGVAGAMEAVSKTLGGRLSNLADEFWNFLVAVGGFGGGVIGDVLTILSNGLVFLKSHLPQIAQWFTLLWAILSPLVTSIKEFFKVAIDGVFGITDSFSALRMFGNVMSGILVVVGIFSTGISTLLNWLQPFAPLLLTTAAAFGVLNLIMWLNPIGFVMLNIISLIALIGIIMKYTDGWGKSFTALGNLLKLWWQQVKADFSFGVDTAIYHFKRLHLKAFEIFDLIGQKIANVGKSIKQALDFDFNGAYDTLNQKVSSKATDALKKIDAQQKKDAKSYTDGTMSRVKQAKKEIGDLGVTFDTDKAVKDWRNAKKSITGATGEKKGDEKDYLKFIEDKNNNLKAPGQDPSGKDKNKKGDKDKDGIVSGGSKQTNIVININKLQDHTIINVDKSEKGVSQLGDAVQEQILRAVNSVNQMQTG